MEQSMIFQSATSITDYKLCPMLYYLRHVLRLRPIEEPETLRIGSSWHKCLEILTDPNGGQEAMIDHLNRAYAKCPPSVELTDWEVERTILLYTALGWQWHWQNDQVETLAREVSFNRQVNNLYSRRGKIDRVIRRNRQLHLGEYKSTSKPIDPGSLYWDRLKLDSQLTLYLIEARHAQLAGQLEQYGISASDSLISGMLYDVWRKPTIRPKKLTQADTKKFLEDGKYFEEQFIVHRNPRQMMIVEINGIAIDLSNPLQATSGKKEGTFAIRETPEMFGARLLADIREQPDRYFARKEIARTDQELQQLNEEYANIARLTDIVTRRHLWFKNEHHCDATYRCAFYPICYYNLDVTDGKVPDGFRCLNKS
jgi:hypothetical protein